MNIPDAIIENIHSDPLQAAISTCDWVLDMVGQTREWGESEHGILLEAYALITAMEAAGLITYRSLPNNVEGDRNSSCGAISVFLTEVSREFEQQLSGHKLESLKKKFANIVSVSFAYEFSEGDVTRIQTLINELRELIAANDELEEQHKRRLLKRLEKLQAEMHKKMSDLDHFYGLAVEGSVMLKKVGGNLKPIVERIAEITKITWTTQARAEDLPSGSEPPLIGRDVEPAQIEM